MENQDKWFEQAKSIDANKVVIGVVFAAAIGILIQALLLYLFF